MCHFCLITEPLFAVPTGIVSFFYVTNLLQQSRTNMSISKDPDNSFPSLWDSMVFGRIQRQTLCENHLGVLESAAKERVVREAV